MMSESAIRNRAKKLDLMVRKDGHGEYFLVDPHINGVVAPGPMTLEQLDSWLTDLENQSEN